MGIVRFALRFPHTFYVRGRPDPVSRRRRHLRHAAPTSFRRSDIPVVTVIWSYTGLSTPEMEQRVTTYSQYSISANVNGIKNIEAQTHERAFGPEDLLPARRQSRPRDRADRRGDQRHSRAHAAGHPAADRCAVQRLERAGAADQPELRHPQRAAALRLRHLSHAPAAGADPRHHAADAGRRQISPDHGRYRSGEAAWPRA